MRLRTSLKIAIIGLSAFFSLSSLAEVQRVAIKQITDTFKGFSSSPSISGDGTKVAFVSVANITGSNEDGSHEIFLYDISTGKFTQITNTTAAPAGRFDRPSSSTNLSPSISANGNKVTFVSEANITGSNGDGNQEIFLYKITEGKFIQITNTAADPLRRPDPFAIRIITNDSPSISADGNKVAFVSEADITGSNKDGNDEIFLYDITTGRFTQITNTTTGSNFFPSISADGTKVVFLSEADITGSNGDRNVEIFLYNITTSNFTQITNTTARPGPLPTNSSPSINADGTKVAFESNANITGSFISEIFLATIQESFPYVLLSRPVPTLKAGDPLRLDLILQPGQSPFHIDVFFSIEIGSKTLYLAPDLTFVSNRIAVASNFLLTPDMSDLKATIFGPSPSILGEVIIPPDVSGSFTFKVDITNSQTGESLGSDKVTFLVLAPIL